MQETARAIVNAITMTIVQIVLWIFDWVFHFYRPQRSCGQGYVFTRVCHSVNTGGGVFASVHAGIPSPRSRHPPPGADPPGTDTPPRSRHTPGADTPQEQTPPGSRPHLGANTPPGSRHPLPPPEADSGIRSMSGRYASYWNAFLFKNINSLHWTHRRKYSEMFNWYK